MCCWLMLFYVIMKVILSSGLLIRVILAASEWTYAFEKKCGL